MMSFVNPSMGFKGLGNLRTARHSVLYILELTFEHEFLTREHECEQQIRA